MKNPHKHWERMQTQCGVYNFLPQCKDMRVNGDSKMAIGVNGKLSRVDPSYGYKLKLDGWMDGWKALYYGLSGESDLYTEFLQPNLLRALNL